MQSRLHQNHAIIAAMMWMVSHEDALLHTPNAGTRSDKGAQELVDTLEVMALDPSTTKMSCRSGFVLVAKRERLQSRLLRAPRQVDGQPE